VLLQAIICEMDSLSSEKSFRSFADVMSYFILPGEFAPSKPQTESRLVTFPPEIKRKRMRSQRVTRVGKEVYIRFDKDRQGFLCIPGFGKLAMQKIRSRLNRTKRRLVVSSSLTLSFQPSLATWECDEITDNWTHRDLPGVIIVSSERFLPRLYFPHLPETRFLGPYYLFFPAKIDMMALIESIGTKFRHVCNCELSCIFVCDLSSLVLAYLPDLQFEEWFVSVCENRVNK
jgi:hypothetical protein